LEQYKGLIKTIRLSLSLPLILLFGPATEKKETDMNPTNSGIWNLFGNKTFMGFAKKNNKKETYSYSRMMQKRIEKRRTRNKIARKMRKKQSSKIGPGRNKRLLRAA
jgi:TPP-dependent trihydroxycyclohexane-1,2-dione (THcHDO) dehydratase